MATGVFRKEGDYWTIAYAGIVCRLRDAKGLHYIAHLLRYPGRELCAAELASTIGGRSHDDDQRWSQQTGKSEHAISAPADDRQLAHGRAVKECQALRADLVQEIEEAERLQDVGRATLLRERFEILTAHLIASAGAQRAPAERARLAVTKAIKASLQKIRKTNPSLHHHLASRVKTGYLCAYFPDIDHPIHWQLAPDPEASDFEAVGDSL